MPHKQRTISETEASVLWRESPDGLLLVDADRVVAANPSAEELFGYDNAQFRSLLVDDLVPRHLASSHSRQRDKFHASSPKRSMDPDRTFLARRHDGSSLPVHIGLTPLGPPSGLILTFVRDLSRTAALEQLHDDDRESLVQHLFAVGISLHAWRENGVDTIDPTRFDQTLDVLDRVIANLSSGRSAD